MKLRESKKNICLEGVKKENKPFWVKSVLFRRKLKNAKKRPNSSNGPGRKNWIQSAFYNVSTVRVPSEQLFRLCISDPIDPNPSNSYPNPTQTPSLLSPRCFAMVRSEPQKINILLVKDIFKIPRIFQSWKIYSEMFYF